MSVETSKRDDFKCKSKLKKLASEGINRPLMNCPPVCCIRWKLEWITESPALNGEDKLHSII